MGRTRESDSVRGTSRSCNSQGLGQHELASSLRLSVAVAERVRSGFGELKATLVLQMALRVA
jgi:hypothetical protein